MAFAPLHALRIPDVFKALESSPAGLAAAEVEARLSLYGPNVLYEPSEVPLWRKFAAHMMHPMAGLLWVAGVISILIGHPVAGVIILIVVVGNASFSFWQEYRAQQAMAALRQVLPASARVVRAGIEIQVPASSLVPGDVLVLAEGDNVPADARVVEERGLRANHATLTGDAVPVRKTAEASVGNGLTELEHPNVVFAGTTVVSGTGRAVVFATGMLSQFGRIAQFTQAVHDAPSPLQREIARVTGRLAVLAVGTGVAFLVVNVADMEMSLAEAIVFALGIIVAITPEGLLPTVTLSLAAAVQRLAQHGVLVKKLAIVETLGKTSVICTDKSGTLTQNQMTVCQVWVGGQRLSLSGVGYGPQGDFSPRASLVTVERDLEAFLLAAELCNNSRLVPPSAEHPGWTCLGDQTEAALRAMARKGGIDERAASERYPRVHELPFDARRKRMSTIHANGQVEITFVKGAPKETLQLCTHILERGQVRPLDNATCAEILAANDAYARGALRVLALARRDLESSPSAGRKTDWGEGKYTPEKVEQGLTFLGLAAMMDPPRPEVAEAIQACHTAGIRMVMVTGDYGLTAESLARRVGMLTSPHPHILTGVDVEAMDNAALQAALDEETIFARMAPEHKLRLVAALQSRGEVVAVTGDGVNDAPALRKADVGIAMGIVGADVCKEAADVILTNDNFAAIIRAVEEGRAVHDNIRNFITYIFASNVPEIAPFVMTALFGFPLALSVSQILAIDLGTDLLPALALGTERPEPHILRRPPVRKTSSLFDRELALRFAWLGIIEVAACYAGFFLVYYLNGYTSLSAMRSAPDWIKAWAATVFMAGVVSSQIGNAFTCRKEKVGVHKLGWFSNRFLVWGIVVELVMIVALIYVPPLAEIFDHFPLPAENWLGLLLYAPVVYGLDRIRKGLLQRLWQARERQEVVE